MQIYQHDIQNPDGYKLLLKDINSVTGINTARQIAFAILTAVITVRTQLRDTQPVTANFINAVEPDEFNAIMDAIDDGKVNQVSTISLELLNQLLILELKKANGEIQYMKTEPLNSDSNSQD